MSHDIAPAIRRAWKPADSEAEIASVVRDDTRFERGLGDIGKTVQHVAHECPLCGHDEMVRLVHMNPESRDDVAYWCLRPNCRHFVADFASLQSASRQPSLREGGQSPQPEAVAEVADELSWATKPHPSHPTDTPEVWDNTAVCPWCDTRHTVEVTKHSLLHERLRQSDSDIVETHCEECETTKPWGSSTEQVEQ